MADPVAANNVEALPEAGLTGRVDGRRVRLGCPGWLDPGDLAAAGDLAADVARMQRA